MKSKKSTKSQLLSFFLCLAAFTAIFAGVATLPSDLHLLRGLFVAFAIFSGFSAFIAGMEYVAEKDDEAEDEG